MARVIEIDDDTLIGYDFENTLYFITNKKTTTTRVTKEEAKQVLDIVAPSNTITLEQLQLLHDNYETLQNLYYTYEDTGKYIHTIQLNSYNTHPLTLDLTRAKLYIMNSDLIFDLTLNESVNYRVPYLIDYYKNKLGLLLTTEQMTVLYNFLVYYYNPNFYIEFQPRVSLDTTLYYSNIIKLQNPNNESPVTYKLTYNPTEQYTGQSIANIVYINQNNNTIQLTEAIPEQLQIEDQIIVKGTVTKLDEADYTDDGTYTIQALYPDEKLINVVESLPIDYAQEFLPLYLTTSQTAITSIDREAYKVTLTNVPDTIQIGNKIWITGTSSVEDQQTVSADGEYTIANITGNSLIVSEQIPIDYIGTTAYVYKQTHVAYVSSIDSNHINLFDEPTVQIERDNVVKVQNQLYTVFNYSEKTVVVDGTPTPYTLEFAQLQEPVQVPLVNVEITDSTLTNIPNGSFMVDTYEQACRYIQLITPLYTLPSSFEQMLSKRVAMTMTLLGIEAQCLGIYSDIYSGNA